MKKFLLILLFAVALSTKNETHVPETTHSKWVEILEKNYKIFYASLPTNLRKAVTLYKKHKTWEPFISKLEKLGEQNATKICQKKRPPIPIVHYKPIKPYNPIHPNPVDPMHLPGTCLTIVNAIVNIIKRFKK